MELNVNHRRHDCLQIIIDLVFYKTQAHLYQSIEMEVSRRGIQRATQKRTWSPLEHIPANVANSSARHPLNQSCIPHISQRMHLRADWGQTKQWQSDTGHLLNIRDIPSLNQVTSASELGVIPLSAMGAGVPCTALHAMKIEQ